MVGINVVVLADGFDYGTDDVDQLMLFSILLYDLNVFHTNIYKKYIRFALIEHNNNIASVFHIYIAKKFIFS